MRRVLTRQRPQLVAGSNFTHAGDYGDLLYNIVAIKIIGGGSLTLHPDHPRATRIIMTEQHAKGIIPLLEVQPYISKVDWQPVRPPTSIVLDGWRHTGWNVNWCNLQDRCLRYLKLPIQDPTAPWLFVPEKKRIASVIFHRSDRRHNPLFDWNELVERYKDIAVFIGTAADYKFDLPFYQCKDLLDMAQVIAGADMFIGNQSCPLAVAEGLKKPLICEMYDHSSVPFIGADAIYGPPMPPPRQPMAVRIARRPLLRQITRK